LIASARTLTWDRVRHHPVIGAALRAATLSLIATAHHSIFLLVIAGAFYPPATRSPLRFASLIFWRILWWL
jgi:hypothetical protein